MFARNTTLAACVTFAATLAVLAAQAAPFPELTLKDRSGNEQSLSAFQGKIVVLNFWATWCGPCRDELPMLDKLSTHYDSKDVVFVAVSIDDKTTQNKIATFLEKKKIENLPIYTGATAETLKQFDLGIAVPATIILDRDGEVIGRVLGEAEKRDITSRVDWALNGKHGKKPKPVQKNL